MARQQFTAYQKLQQARSAAKKNPERYTAYQIYQDTDYQDASRARVQSYREDAYNCPHSQRALIAQFDDFAERNHFDGPYMGCCGQPVEIFEQNPQYLDPDEFVPPVPKDCAGKAQNPPCYTARLQNLGILTRCTNSPVTTGKIWISCHQACPEFASIPKNGGKWYGKYGTITIQGVKGNEALLEYTLRDELRAEVYDGCTDFATYTETFCGQAVQFDIYGGLTEPEGCYCDACGYNGTMTPVNLISSVANMPTTTWENTWEPGLYIAGTMSKNWSWAPEPRWTSPYTGGTYNIAWSSGPTYNPGLRTLTGTLGTMGSATRPVCCGGEFHVTMQDTCETMDPGFPNSSSVDVYWDSDADGSIEVSETPSGSPLMDGVALSDGGTYTFTATPACSYSSSADLSVADTVWAWAGTNWNCSEADFGSVSASDGTLSQTVTVHIKADTGCSNCCGRAKMVAQAADGCGHDADAKYFYIVGSYSGGNPIIGWKLYCQWNGSYYEETKEQMYCDGTLTGISSALSPTVHSTLENCLSGLDLNGPGLCGSGGMSACNTCCNYGRLNSVARVMCADTSLCCDWLAFGDMRSNLSWGAGSPQTCCF